MRFFTFANQLDCRAAEEGGFAGTGSGRGHCGGLLVPLRYGANTSDAKVGMEANVFEPAVPMEVMGKRILKNLCAEVGISVEQVIAILKRHGIAAGAEDSIETLARKSGMSPAELFTMVSDNREQGSLREASRPRQGCDLINDPRAAGPRLSHRAPPLQHQCSRHCTMVRISCRSDAAGGFLSPGSELKPDAAIHLARGQKICVIRQKCFFTRNRPGGRVVMRM